MIKEWLSQLIHAQTTPYILAGIVLLIIIVATLNTIRRPWVGHTRYKLNRLFIRPEGDTSTCIWCKRTYRPRFNHRWGSCCSYHCYRWNNAEAGQAFKHNNRCEKHKHQPLTYKGGCWQCFVDDYVINHPRPKSRGAFGLKLMGFTWLPTMRTSHDGWKGDKVCCDRLLEDRVKWFTYVKFYEAKNGTIRPLVVGKSGSNKVNASGCDINFSMNPDDGPARRFLIKNGLSWCHEWVLIKGCKSEIKAYRFENKVQHKFELFGS